VFLRYVAIGDSTTEGLMDPDGRGGYRGWADRFAEHLAHAHGPLEYANLAVRGHEARRVRDRQLARALALGPDVSTVVAGVNDLLRPRFDVDEVAADVRAMVSALAASGAVVLTFTMPDLSHVAPLGRLVSGRLRALNARLRDTAVVTGARLVDLEATPVAADPRLWDDDRLHANALGHERIAAALAHHAGLPGFASWAEPLAPLSAQGRLARLRAEARWVRRYFLPWIVRHARGRSSGDGRTCKRPELRVVTP
jgi:lysophospholipase L1-like esterase